MKRSAPVNIRKNSAHSESDIGTDSMSNDEPALVSGPNKGSRG